MNELIRSSALNNIPDKKLQDYLASISELNLEMSAKNTLLIAVNRYAESNIPVEYWNLKMDKHFKGDPRLLQKYNEYITDFKQSYLQGKSICFAGNHGVGKSMSVCCILKKACAKNYSCLYSTLSDVVNVLLTSVDIDKYLARRELCLVDFLVIDEFDSRFMPSDHAADLYARTLESIFRTRSQNKLPTLMCTNSPNILEAFHGSLKNSIESLMKGYLENFVVLGKDHRKIIKESL